MQFLLCNLVQCKDKVKEFEFFLSHHVHNFSLDSHTCQYQGNLVGMELKLLCTFKHQITYKQCHPVWY
jgi:hypothetical protein